MPGAPHTWQIRWLFVLQQRPKLANSGDPDATDFSLYHMLLNYIHSENITPERIFHEKPIQWAFTTPLYNIGEHVANLTPEFRNERSSIPWVKIAGLRHRLDHHYEDTNWTVICAIIYDVLPKFLDELKQL